MRKLIIFLCLTLMSLSSYGEWKNILQNEYMGVYVDSEKIVKNKTLSKIWALMDFTNPEKNVAGNGYSSTVILWLYDCKGSTHRFLSATQYDKNMGGGKVINQVPEAKDWEYVVPNTIGETIGKIACK